MNSINFAVLFLSVRYLLKLCTHKLINITAVAIKPTSTRVFEALERSAFLNYDCACTIFKDFKSR
jgi:hypothetical protein